MKELVDQKVQEMKDIFVAKEERIIENYEQIVKVQVWVDICIYVLHYTFFVYVCFGNRKKLF